MKVYYVLWATDGMRRFKTAAIRTALTGDALIDFIIAEIKKFNSDGLVLSFSYAGEDEASDERTELEQVKAERDRYWDWIKAMGCETCSGDCDKCDGQSGWVWSGEVKDA